MYPKTLFMAQNWPFEPNLPNAAKNFIIFGIETTIVVFFEKNIVHMLGKF